MDSRNRLKDQALRSTAWTVARTGLEQVSGLVSFVVLARLLAPTEFGLFTLAAAATDLAALIALAGWTEAIFKMEQVSEETADTLFWGVLGFATLLAVAFGVLSFPIAKIFGAAGGGPVFIALAASIPLLAAGQIHTARKLREFGHKSMAQRAVVAYLLGTAAAVGIAMAGGGAWSLVVERYVHVTVGTVLAFGAFKWRPRLRFDWQEFRTIAAYSAHVALSQVSAYLVFRIPYFLGGRYLGLALVAEYRMAARSLELVSQGAITPFATVAVPTFARLQDDVAGFRNAYRRFVGVTALLTCPALLGFGVVASEVIPLIFGEKWNGAVPICQILSLSACPLVAGAFYSPALSALGRSKALARLSMLHLITALVFTVVALPLGIEGVALAQVARMYLMLPLQLVVVKTETGLRITDTAAPLAPPFTAALLMAGALMLIKPPLAAAVHEPTLRLLLEVCAGGCMYLVLLLAWGPRYVRWLVDGVKSAASALDPAR